VLLLISIVIKYSAFHGKRAQARLQVPVG